MKLIDSILKTLQIRKMFGDYKFYYYWIRTLQMFLIWALKMFKDMKNVWKPYNSSKIASKPFKCFIWTIKFYKCLKTAQLLLEWSKTIQLFKKPYKFLTKPYKFILNLKKPFKNQLQFPQYFLSRLGCVMRKKSILNQIFLRKI